MDNKGKAILGAAAAGLAITGIVLATKKASGGNGGGGGDGNFTFSNPSATGFPSWPGAEWMGVRFKVHVVNNNDIAVTHTLTLYSTDSGNPPHAQMDYELTLEPGASTDIILDTGDYSMVYPPGYACEVWVADENGNESPHTIVV